MRVRVLTDALALLAARCNVPESRAILSDGWKGLPRRPRFHRIFSNPPVHHGLVSDFRVVRLILRGAARRLRRGGELWIVCQAYIPLATLATQLGKKSTRLGPPQAVREDGRFTVWKLVKVAST